MFVRYRSYLIPGAQLVKTEYQDIDFDPLKKPYHGEFNPQTELYDAKNSKMQNSKKAKLEKCCEDICVPPVKYEELRIVSMGQTENGSLKILHETLLEQNVGLNDPKSGKYYRFTEHNKIFTPKNSKKTLKLVKRDRKRVVKKKNLL